MSGTPTGGVTTPAQALPQLQGATTSPGMAGAPQGSTGFVPSQQALQAAQQQMAGGAGGPGGFQGSVGAPPTGGNPGANGVPAMQAAGAQPMPQWQKGLMGLLTGSPKYGSNAPAIHQALSTTMQAATQSGQAPQGTPRAAPQMMRPGGQQMQPIGQQSPLLPQSAGSLAPWMLQRQQQQGMS